MAFQFFPALAETQELGKHETRAARALPFSARMLQKISEQFDKLSNSIHEREMDARDMKRRERFHSNIRVKKPDAFPNVPLSVWRALSGLLTGGTLGGVLVGVAMILIAAGTIGGGPIGLAVGAGVGFLVGALTGAITPNLGVQLLQDATTALLLPFTLALDALNGLTGSFFANRFKKSSVATGDDLPNNAWGTSIYDGQNPGNMRRMSPSMGQRLDTTNAEQPQISDGQGNVASRDNSNETTLTTRRFFAPIDTTSGTSTNSGAANELTCWCGDPSAHTEDFGRPLNNRS